jgi:hypothetical protein
MAFLTNPEVKEINMQDKRELPRPVDNLTVCQKGVCHTWIKLQNYLHCSGYGELCILEYDELVT